MKLFRLSQDVNFDYETYDSAVVCAIDETDALTIDPPNDDNNDVDCWCDIKDVKVEYIGEAIEGLKRGCIVASYNAG